MKILKKLLLLTVLIVLPITLSACNWFKSDEEIVKSMMEKMSEVDSYSSKIKMQGDLVAPTGEEISLSINMEGKSIVPVFGENQEVIKNNEFFYTFTGQISTAGVSNNFDIDVKMVDENMYIRVNELALLQMFDGINTGQWYYFDINEMSQMTDSENVDIEQAKFTEFIAYAYELYEENEIFTVKKDLGSAKVGKYSTYVYQLGINKKTLVNLLTQLMSKMAEEEEVDLPAEYQTELQNSMQNIINSINFNNLEFYIGKTNSLLYKSLIDISLNTDYIPDFSGGNLSFKIQSEYDDFNKIDKIEAPAESESLNEVLSGFMMMSGPGMDNEFEEVDLTAEEQKMLDEYLQENPDIELK